MLLPSWPSATTPWQVDSGLSYKHQTLHLKIVDINSISIFKRFWAEDMHRVKDYRGGQSDNAGHPVFYHLCLGAILDSINNARTEPGNSKSDAMLSIIIFCRYQDNHSGGI